MRVIIVLLLFTLFSCKTETQKQHNVSAIETCQDIFYSMPNSFEEFVEMYGYSEEHGEGSLSHKPQNISIAFHCSEVSNDLKVKKAINIAMNGEWQEQGVSLLQKELQTLVAENKELTNVMLESLSEEESKSFWDFFFAGPSVIERETILLYNDLMKSDAFDVEQKYLIETANYHATHVSRRKY